MTQNRQLKDAVIHWLNVQSPHCLLVVERECARLRDVAPTLQAYCEGETLHVGSNLSAVLLPIAPQQRPRHAERWLIKTVRQHAPSPILCADIPLLFEPSLRLDPLRLFRTLGKLTPLMVLWPGAYENDILAYAVPEHTHYRTWRHPQINITGI
ncbi:MAG: BREX-3 system P-loop-containing protein BrxF [Anaerolineales bacterium]